MPRAFDAEIFFGAENIYADYRELPRRELAIVGITMGANQSLA
jgi:hypothetical protein